MVFGVNRNSSSDDVANKSVSSNKVDSSKKFTLDTPYKLQGNSILSSINVQTGESKNTYNGVINIRDGKIQSSKLYEKEQHGIGIDNIIDVVNKYNGIYSIEHTDNEFYFSIIIPVQ